MSGALVRVTYVVLVLADEIAGLAETTSRMGATKIPPTGGGEEEAPWTKFFSTFNDRYGSKEDKKSTRVVHLLKNQPPLPGRTVDRIRAGSFVDFATFPMFELGPGEGAEGRAEGEGRRRSRVRRRAERRPQKRCRTW